MMSFDIIIISELSMTITLNRDRTSFNYLSNETFLYQNICIPVLSTTLLEKPIIVNNIMF